MQKKLLSWLHKNNACKLSILWVQDNNIQTLEEAWSACDRGDWLFWMARKLGIDLRKMALCAALCAHTVVQHMKDPRSREAVRVAFLWSRGKATFEQVGTTWAAADRAFYDAEMEANIWAARAALLAIKAAGNGDGANCASAVAASAAWAVEAAGWIGGEKANYLRTAEIARKILTEDVLKLID